jgi:hypothetical protein
MDNFISSEQFNLQFQELQKIVDDLIIVSNDGTCKPKKGVSNVALKYALQEINKVKETYLRISDDREEYNKHLNKYLKVYDATRENGRWLLEKFGENFISSGIKKYLKL